MSRRRLALLVAVAAALVALALAGTGGAQPAQLLGTVGPGFSISLTDGQGTAITQLAAGEYELVVDDRSDFHNFHLSGPGVDVSTGVEFVGRQTFRITVGDGAYTFMCDPHPTEMRGTFTGGAGPAGGAYPRDDPAPGGTPPPTQRTVPSVAVGGTLHLTVGPAAAITLKTRAGKKVTLLAPGRYTVLVRDRSRLHNAHLRGAGVNRATRVPTLGTQTWKVTLRRGTLGFLCDPHARTMKGSVPVRS